MASTVYRQLQLRRDTEANLPTLSEGELFLATDTGELWMGTSGGNIKSGGKYNPATPSNWAGTPPSTFANAVDRMASAVVSLLGGNIP